jgi:hypothetical protein
VRSCIEAAQLALWSAPDEAAGKLHHALNLLADSREVTEKITVLTVDRNQTDNTPSRITVVARKARVVLDD